MSRFDDVLARLSATIAARKGVDAGASWTAKLLAHPELLGSKVTEEAGEVVQAFQGEGPDRVAAESADLIYHWLVLLAAAGVSLDEVAAKLEAREGQSGIAEKASRPR
jgi:phosphoribosyl-ATP pyrophosphohydrolase